MKKVLFTLAFALVALSFASCSSSKGMRYNSHLKAKKSGFYHLSTDNKGCGWSK